MKELMQSVRMAIDPLVERAAQLELRLGSPRPRRSAPFELTRGWGATVLTTVRAHIEQGGHR